MENEKEIGEGRSSRARAKLGTMMQCLCSGEQVRTIEMAPSSVKGDSASNYSSRPEEGERKPDTGNIEEAETSLRESGGINYEMKITLALKGETRKRHSQNYATPPMSIHAVSLLFEALFLKAKSLQVLGGLKIHDASFKEESKQISETLKKVKAKAALIRVGSISLAELSKLNWTLIMKLSGIFW